MGGAARYSGMRESEIFLFIACRSIDIVENTDYVLNMVPPEFIAAANKVLPKVNERLVQLQTQSRDIWHIILEFVRYYDQKLEGERTAKWQDFCLLVEKHAQQRISIRGEEQ